MAKPKRKARATAEEKAEACRLMLQGMPAIEVAEKYQVSEMTLSRWRAAHRAQAIVPPIEEPEEEGEGQNEDAGADWDSLPFLKQMATDTKKRIRAAEKVGNLSAAQKMSRDLGGLLNTISRVERLEKTEHEVIHLRREDLIKAQTDVRARVAAIASRPLLCEHCSRELSVRWGREGRKETSDE